MKYAQQEMDLTREQRKALNEKVLYLIDSNSAEQAGITSEDIYNAYTGEGGLHGLERADFDSYHAYSEKKKEIENGQFFTPPAICQLVAESLRPSISDVVADLTCGKGSFFNFMPVETNCYGCELDARAYKVAHYLYPGARLELTDIRAYKPDLRFDYVVGNPPFISNGMRRTGNASPSSITASKPPRYSSLWVSWRWSRPAPSWRTISQTRP